MAQGQPHVTIAGIPVRFELTFFVIIALLGAGLASSPELLVAWVAIATVSILLHEMGHALAYRAFGHPSHVVLFGFGGVTTGPRLPPGRSIVVSLAGPLSGVFLLGLPALLIGRSDLITSDDGELLLFFVVWVNLVWAFINLLPVLPLDGGNVTASVLELITGRDAERATRIISIVVAALAGVVSLASGYFFGLVFGGVFVAMNINGLRQAKLPEIRERLGEAQAALVAGDGRRATELADAVVARRPPRDLLAVALEIGAWARLFENDLAGAEATIGRVPKEVRPPATLTGSLALAAGRTAEGLSLLAWGFIHDQQQGAKVFAAAIAARTGHADDLVRELLKLDDGQGIEAAWRLQATLHQLGRYPDAVAVGRALIADGRVSPSEVGYHVARSLARSGAIDEALGWLDWAVQQGYADAAHLAADPDLALLRSRPAFAELQLRAAAAAN